eukprot:scaffold2868_cov171-Amphora_coffeaeformis.AAC.6
MQTIRCLFRQVSESINDNKSCSALQGRRIDNDPSIKLATTANQKRELLVHKQRKETVDGANG